MTKEKSRSPKTPKTPQTPEPPQPPDPPAGGGTVQNERYVHSGNTGPPPRTPVPPTPPQDAAGRTETIEISVTSRSDAEPTGVPLRKAYVRKQAAIFLKQVADHFVLYDPLAQTFLRLNRPALSVWEAIGDEERRYVPEILSSLRKSDARMEETDVEATLATFIDNGVLTIVSTTRE